ncbi:MAG: OadG family protein [Spirochaetaceae bacterium]|nr:OadG family protein [Spirochaetaceae bacterium]
MTEDLSAAFRIIGIAAIWLSIFLFVLYYATRLMSYLAQRYGPKAAQSEVSESKAKQADDSEVAVAIAIALSKIKEEQNEKN